MIRRVSTPAAGRSAPTVASTAGPLFGQAYVGYGRDRNRITRTGVVDDLSASPNGNHVTAGAKGGYLMPLGAARIGPMVALDYARAKVDGYTESGDPVLTLNVSGQSVKSLTGQLGLEVARRPSRASGPMRR